MQLFCLVLRIAVLFHLSTVIWFMVKARTYAEVCRIQDFPKLLQKSICNEDSALFILFISSVSTYPIQVEIQSLMDW